jgi:hypothetical protein
MSTPQEVSVDERTVAVVDAGSRWALNFITFALLIDVVFRGLFRHEAAWDLMALVVVSGAISSAYMARHKVQVMGWKVAIIGGVVAMVLSAVIAFVVASFK